MPKLTAFSVKDEDSEKPAPTFGDALSKFAFSGRITRSSSLLVKRSYSEIQAGSLKHESEDADSERSDHKSSAGKKKKRAKTHAGYAPPSKYAHLSGIPDSLGPNLICVFVGTNPGIKTAQKGHAYASPSNLFWKLLHQSGLTPDQRRPPEDDLKLPELYSLGNTNLVSRPTKDQAELSLQEMEESTPILEAKIMKYRPEAICIVGKGIWERIYKAKTGNKLGKEFQFGWQEGWRFGTVEGEYEGAKVFVAVSTSGLVAGYSMARKLEIMTEIGDWVNMRRRERGETAPKGLPSEVVEKAAKEREEKFRKRIVDWVDSVKVEEPEEVKEPEGVEEPEPEEEEEEDEEDEEEDVEQGFEIASEEMQERAGVRLVDLEAMAQNRPLRFEEEDDESLEGRLEHPDWA
jgi:mismatch-specific thymine-DNA glycosylase